MNPVRPKKLSTILSGYFVVSTVLLCSIILIWTYYSATKAINIELTQSFDQRYNIAEQVFEQEADRLNRIVDLIHDDNRMLVNISKSDADHGRQHFKDYIDNNHTARCDLLFIIPSDRKKVFDASLPIPDIGLYLKTISGNARPFLNEAGIIKFSQNQKEVICLLRSKKLVLDDGQVFGIVVAGTLFNNNLSFINRIKNKTDSPAVILMGETDIIAATSKKESLKIRKKIKSLMRNGDGKKIVRADALNLLLSHYNLTLYDSETPVNLILFMNNTSIEKLNRSYFDSLLIILTLFILFIVVTLFFIRHLIYPSMKKITDYTETISSGDHTAATLSPGAIEELNTIGSAMEDMVLSINRARADLEASEKRYRLIADNVGDVIWVMELDLSMSYVSPAVFQLRGYTPEEVLSQSLEQLLMPDSLKFVTDLYSRKMALLDAGDPEGLAPEVFELEQRCKDGSTVWTSTNAKILLDEENNPARILGVSSDITQRMQAEQAVKESEEKYRNLFESSMDAILLLEPEGGYLDCNQAALDMFSIKSKEELATLSPDNLSPQYQPDGTLSSEKARHQINIILEKGSDFFEWRHKRLDGEEFYASILATRITISGKTILQGTIRDITDFKRSQEMMVQSEKMLSVGGLAAGMAHEINNPLAGMMQTANVMANRLGSQGNLQANRRAAEEAGVTLEGIQNFMKSRGIFRMLDTIHESGHRVAEIVNNMLSFARKSDAEYSTCDPAELMEKTLKLAATDYDLKKHYDFKTIEIEREYEEELPMIICESAKIQQVLLNILRNGAQAMQENRDVDNDAPLHFIIRLAPEQNKSRLRIEIEDNGPGIEESIRKRIFEPFFTTKPPGIGTGLGLSVSYFIVTENHGGTIDVVSEPGKGATFIISLPVNSQERTDRYLYEI